jgi:hypothetical protein
MFQNNSTWYTTFSLVNTMHGVIPKKINKSNWNTSSHVKFVQRQVVNILSRIKSCRD